MYIAFPLSLEKFVIQEGTIQYNNRFAKQKLTIGSIDYLLALSLDKNLQNVTAKGEINLTTISLYSKEIKKELTDRSLRFNHALAIDVIKGNCIITDTKLVFQKIGVAISGTIKNFNATPISALANSENIHVRDKVLLYKNLIALACCPNVLGAYFFSFLRCTK